MRAYYLTISFLIISVNLFSQSSADTLLLNNDYKFSEGIFLSIEAIKNNKPVPIDKIKTDLDKNLLNFYDLLILEDDLYVTLENGLLKKINSSDIIAYSNNGELYFRRGTFFFFVSIVGSISYFVCQEVSYDLRQHYSSYEYYSPVETLIDKEYILNLEDNSLSEFSIKILDEIFSKDVKLNTKWSKLSKRKKKKTYFLYIKEYNNNNPTLILNKK